MKQVKFFLVALMAAVMGVSVSSCMNGEENTIFPVAGVITIKSNFLQTEFQVDGGGVTFIANKAVESLANAQSGDIVFLSAQYDTKTQPVDQNTSKIYVDVNFAYKINTNAYSLTTADASNLANRSIIPLSNFQGADPTMYGTDWVIIPIPYYTEKHENFSQHSFTLAYLKDEEVKNSTLKLHLYHRSSEEIDKEQNLNLSYNPYETYKAFRIKELISDFTKNNKDQAPKNIVIIAQEASNKAVEIKEGATGITEREYTVQNYTAK